jgi:hypothetical protein
VLLGRAGIKLNTPNLRKITVACIGWVPGEVFRDVLYTCNDKRDISSRHGAYAVDVFVDRDINPK